MDDIFCLVRTAYFHLLIAMAQLETMLQGETSCKKEISGIGPSVQSFSMLYAQKKKSYA